MNLHRWRSALAAVAVVICASEAASAQQPPGGVPSGPPQTGTAKQTEVGLQAALGGFF